MGETVDLPLLNYAYFFDMATRLTKIVTFDK